MSRLNKNDRKWLEGKFGNRVNFNPTERLLYGHDIAAIPSLFKPLVGRTMPDAVVQPADEEEAGRAGALGERKTIPLVPRGKASSGYGGVAPDQQGARGRFLPDEGCPVRRRRRDGYGRGRHHLGDSWTGSSSRTA